MTEPLDLLRRYLATLADPEAGEAHFELHTPGAMLVLGGAPATRDRLDRAAFAAAHREAAATLRAQGRGFPADTREAEATWTPAGEGAGVATLRLDDPGRAAPLWVAAGLERQDGGWAVAWATLDGAPPPTDFAVGKALALSEVIFLESQQGLPTRGWLDVVYRRRFRYARPELDLLPGERFSCHGSGSCCQIYWEIDAPPAVQAFIDAMPWAAIGAPHLEGYQLPAKGEDRVSVKKAGQRCTFLDDDLRCRIHATLGTPVFSACVAFPYRFAETPDGVAVTNSFHCTSVRENLGPLLADSKEDIWQRLNQAGLMTAPGAGGYRFDPENVIEWEDFDAIEARLKAALGDERHSLFRRLWIASRSLEAMSESRHPAPDLYASEEITPLADYELQVAETFAPFLLGCLSKLGPDLEALATVRPRASEVDRPERVARWLRALHHSKDFAYKYDLVTAHTVTVALYMAVLALEAHHGGPIPEQVWGRLGTATAHNTIIRLLDEVFKSAEFMRDELSTTGASVLFLRWVTHLSRQVQPA